MERISWIYRPLAVVALILPFIVAVSAIIPDVMEYRVPRVSLSDSIADDCYASYAGRASIRQKINAARLGVLGGVTGSSAISTADRMLTGILELPDYSALEIELPFDAADLEKGPPSLQLRIGALLIGDIFLEAYKHSGTDEYLDAAVSVANAFLAYEEGRWLPKGFLWNDHAVAARLLFLTRLFDAVASRHRSDTDQLRSVLKGIDRGIRLLAKPSQFTYRTNHGMVQNLAILHASAFCKELPAAREFESVAAERIAEQMEIYMSPEGVVPEHSSEYQEFGVALVEKAIFYFEELGRPVPTVWRTKLTNSRIFLEHITRPDGSLPRYGNSGGISNREPPLSVRSPPLWFNEDLGLWSSWFVSDAHLFVPWLNFPGGAHKHADEMAVFFWYAGEEWWSATGYWPYGKANQEWAIGWEGSNAPRWEGERFDSLRSTEVVASTSTKSVQLLHLRRTLVDGPSIDRFIITDVCGKWMVIDAPTEPSSRIAETSWMTMPEVSVSSSSDSEYLMSSGRSTARLQLTILRSPDVTSQWVRGSASPYAGWVSIRNAIFATNAMTSEMPPGSWMVMSWQTGCTEPDVPVVDAFEWGDMANWTLRYRTGHGPKILDYRLGELVVSHEGTSTIARSVVRRGEGNESLNGMVEQLTSLEKKYDRHRYLLPWRIRAMKILLGLAIVNSILVLGVGLFVRVEWRAAARFGSLLVWLTAAAWLHFAYFSH
ncbi:heparinase II/III family protein [Lentisalinibacter orientalis]|uniref:heparinase II/III family protein n=1 Tax=Lentisalinibacter orientalis TaxID=2992241 RepID=UPI0038696CAF